MHQQMVYPDDYTENYLGWGPYSWGWWGPDGRLDTYGAQATWYPLVDYSLVATEEGLTVTSMQYKLVTTSSAANNLKCYEVFVPSGYSATTTDPSLFPYVTKNYDSLDSVKGEVDPLLAKDAKGKARVTGDYFLVFSPRFEGTGEDGQPLDVQELVDEGVELVLGEVPVSNTSAAANPVAGQPSDPAAPPTQTVYQAIMQLDVAPVPHATYTFTWADAALTIHADILDPLYGNVVAARTLNSGDTMTYEEYGSALLTYNLDPSKMTALSVLVKVSAKDAQGTALGDSTVRVGVVLPVDISLTLGFPSAVGTRRDDIEGELKSLPGFIQPAAEQGDLHTYHYRGVDSTGQAKLWTVQTSTNQASFLSALQSTPYVYYSGHANSGAGFSLKARADDPEFDQHFVHGVDDFLHLRNPQAAVPWHDFQTDPAEYPNFGAGALPSSQIPAHPANYAVKIPFSSPIVDGYTKPNNERYPNNSTSPDKDDHVPAGGTFNLQPPNGTTEPYPYHMHTKTDASEDDPDDASLSFTVVNLDNGVKPTFGYKIFCALVCYGARDYGEVFTHGTFIGSINEAGNEPEVLTGYVKALTNGGGPDDIIHTLESGTILKQGNAKITDYAQKNF